MELSKDQLQQIVESVISHLQENPPAALSGAAVRLPAEFYAMQREFGEHFARIDTELVAIHTRIEDLIHQIDKRFEQIDKRFEQVDRRFEELIHYMDKRFEQVDKRFVSLQWGMGLGFTVVTVLMTVYTFLA